MVLIVTTTFIIGCAGSSKIKVPVKEKAPVYELGGLNLTTDANQMTGVARDRVKLSAGETMVIYVRGQSTIESVGKWYKLPGDVIVNWKADTELEVTPEVGHVVTVKVVKPISTSAFVTASTTNKNGEKIEKLFTVEEK